MNRRFGTIRPTAAGTYQAIYQHRLTGGRQVARTFDSRSAAERWLDAERMKLEHGDWYDPSGGRMRVGQFFESWIASRTLAPRTIELYQWLWSRHIGSTFDELRLSEVTPALVRLWFGQLSRAARPGAVTTAKCYRLLSTVMRSALDDGMIVRHPCTIRGAGVERSPEMRTISVPQVWRLADEIGPLFRPLVLVAGFGGLRWGECAGLAIDSVDLTSSTISVNRVLVETTAGQLSFGPPKTAAGVRTVHLPASVIEELGVHLGRRRACQDTDLLFTTVTGHPLRRSGFAKPWHRATSATGVGGLRFHDLRHTAATLATTHGATIKEVQSRLGHSTPHAALRYQHAVGARDRAVASMLDEAIRRSFGLQPSAIDPQE